MSGAVEPRSYATRLGTFLLRPQEAGDDAFVYGLFRADCIARLALAGLPDAAIDQLVGFQHRAQVASYRAAFPNASWSIVVWEGEAIGRLVTNDDDDDVYVVDVVLRPDRQRRGLTTALLAALMKEWATRGRGARAEVMTTNMASLKLWRKLGFSERPLDAVHVVFNWRDPETR
jgi:ribosomal protein S18 acetylase RimI-like enzyme